MRWRSASVALGLAALMLARGEDASCEGTPRPATSQLDLATRFEGTSCAKCHEGLADELLAPVLALRKGDVHAAAGITCADCHGGDPSLPAQGEMDPERSMSKAAGYIGKPKPTQIPQLCARCHANAAYMHKFNPNLPTDQFQQYQTSTHGKRNAAGDEKVATCVSCHGAHGILPASDPRAPVYPTHVPDTCGHCHADASLMSAYGIPATQLAEYKTSVHGKALYEHSDLSAPTCNDCHGNHGAAPPGITSVARICGECHVTSRNFFAAGPHKEAFDAADLPECTACHGNHAIQPANDALVGTEPSAWCSRCHSPGDEGLMAGTRLRGLLDSLTTGIAASSAAVDRASRAGMDASAGELLLQDAHTALVQARDLVHTTDAARVRVAMAAGMKASHDAGQIGQAALAERDVRRRGLALSLVFIGILCAGLFALIRRVDARSGL